MSHPSIPGDMRKRLRSTAAILVAAAIGGSGLAFVATSYMRYDYRTAATVKIEPGKGTEEQSRVLAKAVPDQVRSDGTLDAIVRDLQLDANIAFMGTEVSATGVILDLFAPGEISPGEREILARKRLSDSIGVTEAGNNIAVVVTTADPVLSARISNHIADDIAASVNSGALGTHTQNVSPVAERRQALEKAEADLSAFEAARDSATISRIQENQGQVDNLQAEIATAADDLASVRLLSEQASALKSADILSRNLPDDPLFLTLVDIRQRYAAAKLALDEVSVSHGPRHPRVMAANDAMNAVRTSVEPALKRLQADLKQDEKQRAATVDGLRKKLASLKASNEGSAEEANEFKALHAAQEKARNDYVAAMDEANIPKQPSPDFVAVVSARAEAAKATSNRTDSLTVGLVGALFGLAAAMPFLLAPFFRRRDEDEATIYRDIYDDEHELFIEPAPQHDLYNRRQSRRQSVIPQGHTWEEIYREEAENAAYGDRETGHVHINSGFKETWAPQGHREKASRFAAANSDVSVADRVLAVLANGGSGSKATENSAGLPPMLAAAMRGEVRHEQRDQDMRQPLRRIGDVPYHYHTESQEELEDVRREMAQLSDRVRHFASRRGAGR